ncbi:MAG TPA: hypothetical protein VK195_16715 [Burkholderiaceae bacterium]|nr:hypothetical protein [Burkholderiaceae bacterium]
MIAQLPKRQRLAPAFQLEVRAPFSWRLGFSVLWGLACCSLGLTLSVQAAEHLGPWARAACGLLTVLALPWVCRAAWRWRAGEVKQLLWDGQAWSLRAGEARRAAREDAVRQAVELRVAMDFGSFLLLCCRPAEGVWRPAAFLPLARHQHPGLWLPLRWALFSARGLPPGPA